MERSETMIMAILKTRLIILVYKIILGTAGSIPPGAGGAGVSVGMVGREVY
jgi:hypothetical protein